VEKKRWILFPPDCRPEGVGDDSQSDYYESPEAAKWLLEYYPKCKDKAIECVQKPGEIIFVPSGWWHSTFNITLSIAITQNFAQTGFFERVAEDLVKDKDDFYQDFKRELKRVGRNDLLDMLKEHLTASHGELLEWIIIALIAIEIVMGIVEICIMLFHPH